MTPGREFVGPGLEGINITSGLIRHERSAPAIVAVVSHGLAPPLPIVLATPNQRGAHYVVPIAIDIRPDLDPLTGDPFTGKRPPSISG